MQHDRAAATGLDDDRPAAADRMGGTALLRAGDAEVHRATV
jgi:hypothetical protein